MAFSYVGASQVSLITVLPSGKSILFPNIFLPTIEKKRTKGRHRRMLGLQNAHQGGGLVEAPIHDGRASVGLSVHGGSANRIRLQAEWHRVVGQLICAMSHLLRAQSREDLTM